MFAFLSVLLTVAETQLLQGPDTVILCNEELQPSIVSQSNPSLPQCDFCQDIFISATEMKLQPRRSFPMF